MRRVILRNGFLFGAVFAAVAVVFILVSTLTDINRTAWVVLNQIKGIVGFSLCGLAGYRVARQTGNIRSAAVTGAMAATIGAIVMTTSLYIIPYSLIDSIRQYPFEHYSYLSSGAENIREYLLSAKGRATATETSIGLIPIVAPLAALLGAALATAGGWIGKRKNGGELNQRKRISLGAS